jgi:two-component system KDP operon response regulator KdpE
VTSSDRHRVLLVEDNDLNRTLVRTIIERSAEPIAKAVTLIEAPTLEAARAELVVAPVDLILLDMQLPDGNGVDLARELSGAEQRPTVVALTASVLTVDQTQMRAAGCDDFLGKPYRPQQLIEILTTHLVARSTPDTPGPPDHL